MVLIDQPGKEEFYLYHYTKCSTLIDSIFPNSTLRINGYESVNDPRESKSWDFSTIVSSLDVELSLGEYNELSSQVSARIKGAMRLLCFCKDREFKSPDIRPGEIAYRGYAKPSMWHHYAKHHSGACLVFDGLKLKNAILRQLSRQELTFGSVEYVDKSALVKLGNHPFSINLTELSAGALFNELTVQHKRRWFDALFFQKLTDWSNEDEYRVVYFDDESQDVFTDVNFEDSLVAVVVGENAEMSHKECIYQKAAALNIEAATMEWWNGYPRLVDNLFPVSR